MNEKFCILIQISLKLVSEGPIDFDFDFGLGNDLAPTSNKPEPGPMLTQFAAAYIWL